MDVDDNRARLADRMARDENMMCVSIILENVTQVDIMNTQSHKCIARF
jgi:hypothetical protein